MYVDEDGNGKQKVKSKTWKPPANMTSQKKIEKELQKTAAIFEEQVKKGLIAFDGNTTFAQYSEEWLSNANIAVKTKERYEDLLRRINQGIGHIRLSKLEARHIRELKKNLGEAGVKQCGYAEDNGFSNLLVREKLSYAAVSRLSGVAASTVSAVCDGRHISIEKAQQLAGAFNCKTEDLFKLNISSEGLSDKTILQS